MIQDYLTIDEAAERLKDRGYTYELIQAAVAAGRIPYRIQNLVILIPFPEADQFFPPIPEEKATEQKAASKKAVKKSKA